MDRTETEQDHVHVQEELLTPERATLEVLLDPKWVRDENWGLEVEFVLLHALSGLNAIWSGDIDWKAEIDSQVWKTNNGTVLVDELARIAWVAEQYAREQREEGDK